MGLSPAAATAPTQDALLTPPAYYRAFAADTDSIVLINELGRFLTAENYNDFQLQLLASVYERAAKYLSGASNTLQIKELRPDFIPDADGGIEIEWENQDRRLVLTCRRRADEDFISWREAGGRYEGNTASERLLIDKLNWLIS